jgi:signal transduction histidine kinase
MLRQIVEEVRPDLQNHSLDFDAPAEAVLISGDEVRLEQVFYNLVHNAIKYSPNGGRLDVRLWTDAEAVFVSVRDEGIGIPKEDQARIFENFFRSPNADAARISGLGIGLFVVHEVITMHDGSIEVDSKPGQGTSFTVRLPRLNT